MQSLLSSACLFVCLWELCLGPAKWCQTPTFIQQGRCKHSPVTEAVATATGIALAGADLFGSLNHSD